MNIYYYPFVYSFVVSVVYLFNYVSASNSEQMVGGYQADEHSFKYQAAILGKRNYSNHKQLLCSGGIISEELILSIAQCFLDKNWNFYKVSLSVKVDTINLKAPSGIEIDVDSVLIPDYELVLTANDIAVVQLKEKLDISNNGNLSKLDIPISGQSFIGRLGIIAAYGYNWIETSVNEITGEETRLRGNSDYLLKYALVRITDNLSCNNSLPNLSTAKHICGVMMTEVLGQKWGICSMDIGSPLVIHNIVVGIASNNRADCDDTINGCLYINVSGFAFFLETVLSEQTSINGVPVNTAIRLPNRPHIPPFLSL